MSEMFQKVKDYYDAGKWSTKRVHDAVGKWITAEEYEIITGFPYDVTFPDKPGRKESTN